MVRITTNFAHKKPHNGVCEGDSEKDGYEQQQKIPVSFAPTEDPYDRHISGLLNEQYFEQFSGHRL